MALLDRSLTEVLQNIIRNVQEIVRSEVRLAKTEIIEEATKAKSAALFFSTGAVAAVFATLFLLLMILFALIRVMPDWAAALTVGGALAVAASILLSAGVKRFKEIHPTPERTVETIKENVEWAKQHSK
jgi:uncharacterized membrane protein YqjE